MARFCSHCGAEMIGTAAFCPKCGRATEVQTSFRGAPANPATGAASERPNASPALPPNIAGLLAYFVIPAVVFLFVEPYRRDRFVRFHSFQAIFLWVVFIVINTVITSIPLLILLLLPVFALAELVVGVVCMIKAWQNYMFKLPVLGELSERFAGA